MPFKPEYLNQSFNNIRTKSKENDPAVLQDPNLSLQENMDAQEQLDIGQNTINDMNTISKKEQEMLRQIIELRGNEPQNVENTATVSAKVKPFNLSKISQSQAQQFDQNIDQFVPPPPPEETPDVGIAPDAGMAPDLNSPSPNGEMKFEEGADLKKRYFDVPLSDDPKEDQRQKREFIEKHTSSDNLQDIHDLLDAYFDPGTLPNQQAKLADIIFDLLSEDVRKPKGEEYIKAPLKEVNMSSVIEIVKETNKMIEKMAKEMVAMKKASSEKFIKTAQHKTLENVILWGPTSKPRVDPFTRQPVSDWHIVERNKGFGLVVDDVWNIDWETIWRGNIMDKYTREYRDKDGKWVGGYLRKRFEIDNNIPETSNLQLKPGQLRRPYVPEYGSTEARLEAMREKQARGYEPNSTGKPFNWNEASEQEKMTKEASAKEIKAFNLKQEEDKKKSLKVADSVGGYEGLKPLKLPGDKDTSEKFRCTFCGATTKNTFGPCPGCKQINTGKVVALHEHRPDPEGKQYNPDSNKSPKLFINNVEPYAPRRKAAEVENSLPKEAFSPKKKKIKRLKEDFISKEFKPAINPLEDKNNNFFTSNDEDISGEEVEQAASDLCIDN